MSPRSCSSRLHALLRRFDLDPAFPEAARREVAAHMQSPGIDDPALADLRDLPFVTIDHQTSRDLDQALHLEPTDGGDFLLRYALADASFYVSPRSALFEEALRRGASYYLPGLSVPMLPRELSEGIVSLNADEDRRALIFEIALDSQCTKASTRIYRARVRSRAKLSFRDVQSYYDDPASSPLRDTEYAGVLDALRTVGLLRIEEARSRDVIGLNRAEVSIYPDGDPETATVFRAASADRLHVERYNEQISLLCNAEGARLLSDATLGSRLQPVYRVHESPPPERLEQLEGSIACVAEAHGLGPDWRWHKGAQSLSDFLEGLPAEGPHSRIRQAIERQILYTFQRSLFSDKPGPHYALAVEGYARFSSPMREIAGIFTHKEALEHAEPGRTRLTADEDEHLRRRVIAAANQAKTLQRQVTRAVERLAMDDLFGLDASRKRSERTVRPGTIFGINASRLYVQLDEPPLEIKVYVRDLERLSGCRYELREETAELVGPAERLRVGDEVHLRTAGRDSQHDRWVFEVVAPTTA